MSQYAPLIIVELLMVFGGAVAFAWWQFRDLRREREKRERQQAAQRAEAERAGRESETGHAA